MSHCNLTIDLGARRVLTAGAIVNMCAFSYPLRPPTSIEVVSEDFLCAFCSVEKKPYPSGQVKLAGCERS